MGELTIIPCQGRGGLLKWYMHFPVMWTLQIFSSKLDVPGKIQTGGELRHGISRDIEKKNVKIPGLKK